MNRGVYHLKFDQLSPGLSAGGGLKPIPYRGVMTDDCFPPASAPGAD